MRYSERLGSNAVVPVVVLDDAASAVPAARAILAGGIDVMEITLRTAAGLDSIRAVAESCPEMLVGAGTVLNLEQAQNAVEAGAKFLVSPGFDPEMVRWCVENEITVTPGCVTPTEIMSALGMGVDLVKFFPANVYGGLAAMKSLSAPFGGVRFIPTGGINGENIGEYAAAPFVHTVGGSWVCTKADISAGNFEKITRLCREAVSASLGFELVHVGVNTDSGEAAMRTAQTFQEIFAFDVKEGGSSIFAGKGIEVMKTMYLGAHGHLAVRTNHIGRAAAYLQKKGFSVNRETAKYRAGKMTAVYLDQEIGGFAVHLLQK